MGGNRSAWLGMSNSFLYASFPAFLCTVAHAIPPSERKRVPWRAAKDMDLSPAGPQRVLGLRRRLQGAGGADGQECESQAPDHAGGWRAHMLHVADQTTHSQCQAT